MIIAALSMAKAEVQNYFMNLTVKIPKPKGFVNFAEDRNKYYNPEDYFDEQISDLIGASTELLRLAKTHAQSSSMLQP